MSQDKNRKIKILFACLDWRLHPQIEEYFVNNGAGCDACVTAGSIKGLIDEATRDFFLEQISISLKLHDCQGAILTMHIDCGAYGGSAAFASLDGEMKACRDQLALARGIINSKFPELPVESYIIGIERLENNWVIKPQQI